MILVKVSYDAYNQEFRLVDQQLARMFEDGATYFLATDLLPANDGLDGLLIDFGQTDIGNA